MNFLANLGRQPLAWVLLFSSALLLELTALYFQYAMNLQPCIMCIYQRTAVFGILFSALIPLLHNNILTRLAGYIGVGVSAIWGLLIAIEHVDLQTSKSIFSICEIVPNFPSWAPLHEWLPNIFAATGDCGDINWSFLGMSMPQWMIVVFAIYSALLVLVLLSKLINKKAR
ncbi:MAG: disulfide bond formation protein DsbB [Paraglaciecola sp.]|uniref:disulfide bond formation protein DsbB n=1 Tax=Paraglaciecola sp. TaxID=1920173 RepID=UPI00273EE669|nr:disulfide bond formation protein DsbB [Paraglaciecola sp.]MDP5028919.1 disulfide bond formation protein DsbB [Paraglaciecola sp.]MDP5040508.1 disulfide bond formation protein DsbB [Paraglaciecola sp.]MDP5132587.1 disulfide bond formation protein DsbB [Paraglaciecola sp.]